jgi:uncharacterized protein (TIGR03435 family)
MRRSSAHLLLGIAISGAVLFGAASVIHAQNPPSTPVFSFEVASIKPNDSGSGIVLFTIHSPGRFAVANASPKTLIAWAYNNDTSFQLSDDRILGGPSWISTEKYDVEAKEDDQTVARLEKLPPGERDGQIKLMVRSLLADRFRLRVHHETRELPVYALVVAKGGPKLTVSTKKPSARFRTGEITATAATMPGIAGILSRQAPTGCAPPELEGREVRDETGLSGVYDFTLKWMPEPIAEDSGNPSPPEANGPSIFTALKEQLGLRLESTQAPSDVVVIDHIEQPTPN